MPSRRRLLTLAGAVGTGVFAGCSSFPLGEATPPRLASVVVVNDLDRPVSVSLLVTEGPGVLHWETHQIGPSGAGSDSYQSITFDDTSPDGHHSVAARLVSGPGDGGNGESVYWTDNQVPDHRGDCYHVSVEVGTRPSTAGTILTATDLDCETNLVPVPTETGD